VQFFHVQVKSIEVTNDLNRHLCLLISVLFLSLVLRLWGAGFGLPQRYHIDEPPYVLAALRIATGDLDIAYPYNSPNLFEFMLTGLYGLWYVAGWLAGTFSSPADIAELYQRDPTVFFLLARGLSALLSTITVALVYSLGQHLRGRPVGLLAASLLALTFGHVRAAHYAVTDTLVTSLVVVSLLETVLYAQSHRKRHLALAGLTGGAAVGLKYLPAPVLVPPLLALLEHQGNLDKPQRVHKGMEGILVLGCCSLIGFLFAFPAPLVSLDLFRLQWHQVWTQATGPLGSIRVDSAGAPLYYLKTLVWDLGIPMLVGAIVGFALWLRKRRSTGYLYVIVFVVSYFTGISLVKTAFARYALPLVPPLVLLATKAIVGVVNLVRRSASALPAKVVGVILCLMVGGTPAAKSVRHNVLLGRTDTRTLAQDWIDAHVPSGTRIAMQWYGPALSGANDPEPGCRRTYDVVSIDPFDEHSETYDLDTYQTEKVAYLVVNSWGKSFQHKDLTQNQMRERFFLQLEVQAQRVARFQPVQKGEKVPFVFEQIYGPYTSLWKIVRPGPEVEIFAVSAKGAN
jgi:hypothetical protein